MSRDETRGIRHRIMKVTRYVVALSVWMGLGGTAFAEFSAYEPESVCREDCTSAREKCAAVCRKHAGKGVNVCLKACGQMEQECRSDCRVRREVDREK